ncbi:MAG: hypothetical protein GY862_13805 [Gammaproteobacteria bacterium]|nr:hypothetical protein [Gammaproteobacteria bacterium]
MGKTLIVGSSERKPVPFLRGILTGSLKDAGLSFQDAYKLASTVRQELDDTTEISTEELRQIVISHLASEHGSEAAQRYQKPDGSPATILVRDIKGEIKPFSRGQHQRCLQACGLSSEESTLITEKMYDYLVKKGKSEINSERLKGLTYRLVFRDLGEEKGKRYLVWEDFVHSDRPLLLLIGGTAGCGKSTIATEIANRLDIVRTQSTDMLREVMRLMVPRRLVPVLHTSSFTAWQTLSTQEESDPDILVADGYRAQAELLSLACEAVIQRALKERVSLVLEGIHIQPSFLDKIPQDTDAIIVPIMLGVLKPAELRIHIKGRGKKTPDRRSKRYLEHFDSIWRIQSYLLSEADRMHVPIIHNYDQEKAMREIMDTIIDTLARDFSGTSSKDGN